MEYSPLRVIFAQSHARAKAMLRSYHGRAAYTRLDTMADLERRLVRKLGTSTELASRHLVANKQ